MVVADTSVLITWLREPESEVGRIVDSLLAESSIVMTGTVLAEVLQGARTDFEFEALLDRLNALICLDTNKRAFTEAARTVSRLRRAGSVIPLSDALIAEVAKQHNLPVYSVDRHFERVPGLRLHRPELPLN